MSDHSGVFGNEEGAGGDAIAVVGTDAGFDVACARGLRRSPVTARGVALHLAGRPVRIDADGRLSLDDLQRCAGLKAGCSNYRPRAWVHTPRGHAAIEASLRALRDVGNGIDPLVTRLGKGGSTYAVIDAALDYADWLDLRDRLSSALGAWLEAALEA